MAKNSPTPAEILASELAENRARLMDTVADLEDYIRPSNVAARGFHKVSEAFLDDEGKARPERVAAVAAGLAGIVGLLAKKKD